MIDNLFVVAVVMMFAIYVGTVVVGVVLSRRAWKRYGWHGVDFGFEERWLLRLGMG
jgi:hypothetical protein